MFKFDFQIDEGGDQAAVGAVENDSSATDAHDDLTPPKEPVVVDPSSVDAGEDDTTTIELDHVTLVKCNPSPQALVEMDESLGIESDVVPGVYEGGLKVWECTFDLVEYIATKLSDYDGKRVLELGCGAGLPGVYMAQQGALVTFQDFNVEVLRSVTVPNCRANNVDPSAHRFVAGDWSTLKETLLQGGGPFDYILMSETIYSTAHHATLARLTEAMLQPATGRALVAAKTHYFGLGGGTRLFEQRVRALTPLRIASVWQTHSGVKREILEIVHDDN